MISVRAVFKSYDNNKSYAVRDITFEVAQGEVMALVGESGCGKTTTLKMINRLIEPTSGTITIDNNSIRDLDAVTLRRSMGYVIQEIGLFPHMSVGENIGIVPGLLKWSASIVKKRIRELLDLVGLDAARFVNRYPAELSGGQQQRVGLARALAAGPGIMLMDEPFGALDPITRAGVVDKFIEIRNDLNLTVIIVTHDMVEALLLGDKIAVMRSGEITAMGRPADLLANPTDEYAKELLSMPQRQISLLSRLLQERQDP